jgi:two-component system nitrate/nitrite response regulator NarL
MESSNPVQILLYSQQPFVAEGMASVLNSRRDFQLLAWHDNLAETLESLRSVQPDVVLVYPTSRISLSDLRDLRAADTHAQIVLWGQGLSGEFAFQAMQLGVRSILPADTPADALLAALKNVHRGVLCFERDLMENVLLQKRVSLTRRQGQIVSLVARGLKNKEIAYQLGITEGTVKVYLYKLFKKLGMNDRLEMAIYGLTHLFSGQIGVEPMAAVSLPEHCSRPPAGPRSLPPQTRESRVQVVN